MRAIIVAMDLARVVMRQCEYIIKIYSVLIFPSVTLLLRSLARFLCEKTLKGPLRLYSHLSLLGEWLSVVARARISHLKFEQYSGLTQ